MKLLEKIKENKFFSLILILEIIFLINLTLACFQEPRTVTMQADDWKASSELTVKDYEDGSRGVCEIEATGNVDEEVLHSGKYCLQPGAYKVTVSYKSACNLEEPSRSISDSAGKLVLFSYKNPSALSTSTILLDDGSNTRTSRVWVRWGESLDDFQGKILYNGIGEMTIKSVTIEEAEIWRVMRIVGFVILFFFLDGGYLLFSQNTVWRLRKEEKLKICGLGGMILFTSILFLTDSLYYGHDLKFHLERIHALSEAFYDGQIPHRIQQNMLNGYGYVNPLFYGEFFLSVPAALYCMYVPLQDCYKIYAIILNAATCLISYKCFTRMSKDCKIGMFTAFLYTASAYRMIDIFVRADVGEYTAMTFLPLVVYGFWKIYTKEDGEKFSMADYLPLVLGLSGVIECHNLTCYMLLVFIPLFVLLMWKKTVCKYRFAALLKSVLLLVLLNIWYLYPLLDSMKMNIKVTQPGTMGKIEKYGATLSQLSGVFHTAAGDSIWGGVKGEMPLTVGIGLLSALVLYCYVCIKREEWKLANNKDYLAAAVGFVLSMLALFFASIYCPWDSLAALDPTMDQIVGTIQFSWRYLEIATIMLTVVMLFLQKVILEKSGRKRADMAMLGIVISVLLSEGLFLVQYPNEVDYKKYYAESELTGFDVGSGMEYILRNTDTEKLNSKKIIKSDAVTTGELRIIKGERFLECHNTDKKEHHVDIPVLHYDNYLAFDRANGEKITLKTGKNNSIRLVIPGRYQGTVVIKYQEPFLWRLTEIISILTLVGATGYMGYKKRIDK